MKLLLEITPEAGMDQQRIAGLRHELELIEQWERMFGQGDVDEKIAHQMRRKQIIAEIETASVGSTARTRTSRQMRRRERAT
jgi:hypothetical protein